MKLLTILKQAWFLSLLGMMGLSLLVWILGPLFAFGGHEPLQSETHRAWLIIFILSYWLLAKIWTFVKEKRQNNQVLTAIAEPEQVLVNQDGEACKEELEILHERLQDALTTLKKSRLGAGSNRQFLYQLPWYVIIGPPGSGKSTMLKNSDLKFPLSEQYGKDAIRGIGGTRNCDWWFTDEAVMLDTAGRYTSQDSHNSVDQSAWLGFLDLLKKYRPRRPINGVIVAISIKELLEQDQNALLAHAKAIRGRIQELHEKFNMRFPVYLVFTKCDLLAGFMEYFDGMDKDKRNQVWGMTFPLTNDNSSKDCEQFSQEFEQLADRLQTQLIDKLERERGSERRNFIYTFPQQFASLCELSQNFINNAFQANRYEHPVMLRGVYFTSATQEGSPIDRIMGALSNSFGMDKQPLPAKQNQNKSFFINRLLADVIFAEAGLAGANLKLETQRVWLQRGAVIAIVAITTLASLVWAVNYSASKHYIESVAKQAEDLKGLVIKATAGPTDVVALLPILDKARALPGGYADHKQVGVRFDFGLSQRDKLGDAGISLYRQLLKDTLLTQIIGRMEQQLQSNASNIEYLYETLKVYVMLDDSAHYQANLLNDWVVKDWQQNLPATSNNEQRQALQGHLAALLEMLPSALPRPLNASVIEQTRAHLADTSAPERAYAQIKLALLNKDDTGFSVAEQAGRDALLVLTSKNAGPLTQRVPRFYTCAGYQDGFLKNYERIIDQQASDNWVIDSAQKTAASSVEGQALRDNVLRLYFQDYMRNWDSVLADIQLKSLSNQAQLVEMLGVVASESSPLKSLLQAVDKETSFACLGGQDGSLLNKAEKSLNTAQTALNKIIGAPAQQQQVLLPAITSNLVTEHFADLHDLVRAKDKLPSELDRSLGVLNELYVYLNSLAHASGEELVLEQRKQVVQIVDKVKLESKRNQLSLMNKLMTDIADGSNSLVSNNVQKYLNARWQAEVVPFCQKAINGLYPLANSNRDSTVEDFSYFFGPDGLMESFFKKYLAASVEKTGDHWQWLSRGESGSGISSAALRQFQLADSIKTVFFRMGKSPSISFKLKPLSMSTDIEQFMLDVDGQILNYAHGPLQTVDMKWPGPNNSGQVRIELLPPQQGNSGLSKTGPWALLRLFDQASIARTANPTVFFLTFNLHGREAKFELNANSAVNPFQLSEMKVFKCLPNL